MRKSKTVHIMRKKVIISFCLIAFMAIFTAPAFAQTEAKKTDWHRLQDTEMLKTLTKLEPYLGHQGTTTTRTDQKKRLVLSMTCDKDSSLHISFYSYEGKNGKEETSLVLHKWHDRWYTDGSYPDKTALYSVIKKMVAVL
jgi:hypothetical protein